MSTHLHASIALPVLQEEDLNDANWNEVVRTRLPKNWQEKARELQAWQRQRELRSIADLLRALLVYACCQYSVRETSACGPCSKALVRSQSERGANDWISRGHGSHGYSTKY